MSSTLVPVEFNGDTIFAVEHDGQIYIVAKPIAERFGLAWQRQLERLKNDPVLSEGITTVVIPSPGGAQKTTCLRLDLLNGWLFKIDSRRVKPEVREALIAYQRECYAVLFRHFQPTAAGISETVTTNTMPPRFSDGLVTMERMALVREARLAFGRAAAQRMWEMVDLPDVTGRAAMPGVLASATEGRDCLRYLLGLEVGGRAVADWLAADEDSAMLNRVGLRVRADGLFVSNRTAIFAGSRWSGGQHRAALIALDSVAPVPNPLHLGGDRVRGLVVPLGVIAGIGHVE